MKNSRNLIRIIFGKAAILAAMPFILVAAEIPSFAQSAEVRYAGVFYKNVPTTIREMYCDYSSSVSGTSGSLSNADFATSSWNTPSTGSVFTDGDYKVSYVGSSSSAPSGASLRTSSTHYARYAYYYILYNGVYYRFQITRGSGMFGLVSPGDLTSNDANADWLLARFLTYPERITDGSLVVVFTGAGSSCPGNQRQQNHSYNIGDTYWVSNLGNIEYCFTVADYTSSGYSIRVAEGEEAEGEGPNRSFVYAPRPSSQSSSIADPWVSSALIEYDQPYPSTALSNTNHKYPNHCLALCMNVYCNNKPIGGSTYSIAFPLQNIKFDVVKYYNNKNVENPEETPAIRTIDLYPNQESSKCGSYKCPGGTESGNTCGGALYYMDVDGTCRRFADDSNASGECECTNCSDDGDGCSCNYALWNNDGTPSGGKNAIPFCAAWDGSYEINGEFGKTNGDFAFRATVKTDTPGDNVIVDKITFDSTIAYPGMNQIPIQVDVTNIHTVRSTPSVVGNITQVDAQPYTYAYRLSKDADVRISIFDASNGDDIAYTDGTDTAIGSSTTTASGLIVRNLVDWQPRLGEGMKGVEKDVNIQAFDSWDGRNDQGLLLPAGNYVVSLQAKSADEWSGVDFSRAVTRQLSLDPLKLTDIVSSGLTKKSTAYASIAYTPTESSKVYWYIYTPGTTFSQAGSPSGILTDSSAKTGTEPAYDMATGSPVYRLEEDRVGRMNFTSKWDGTCGISGGCTRTYAYNETLPKGTKCQIHAGCPETFAEGAPMPDGNYVYALWAEIPYNGKYVNAVGGNGTPGFTAGGTCSGTSPEINHQCFTGVKTLKYNTGEIAIERGVVDVTIQPVSYATVGSSPTAYGLDPFIFKYSLARDATAIAKVTNSAGVDVKYLTPQDGVTQVAQQMNTLSWDGRDDAGRMVTPGTYMFVVETKDAMFPAVTNRASAVFPVDMYRVVDLATTDVYGDSEARATLSYSLSKAMNVQVNIYNKDVIIPDYTTNTGDYEGDVTVTSSSMETGYINVLPSSLTSVNICRGNGCTCTAAGVCSGGTPAPYTVPSANSLSLGTITYVNGGHRYTVTSRVNPNYNPTSTTWSDLFQYMVTVLDETITTATNTAPWPPRVCATDTDGTALGPDTVFNANGSVNPSANPKCIYVNDTSFTHYPSAADIANGTVDVRLQPVKTFERSSLKPGDGLQITEEWDALYFNNPSKCTGSTSLSQCPYEMVPDGQYPFFVSARSNEGFDRYYFDKLVDTASAYTTAGYSITGQPFKLSTETVSQPYLYATDKVTGKINVTRGAVYFLDGSTVVYPNAPQLFNVSSGPVFVPPYEINFSVSRAATVEIAIVALQAGVCNPDPAVHQDLKNNVAGDVCKFLSTMTIANTGNFDPNIVRKAYWDGTDNNGFYVKPGIYEVRLTAKNYPNPDLYEPTVKQITLNADLLKVFDLLEADGYSISQRGTNMKIGYQVSVPMKVALQIFKPGTTIYDYEKGTLRNPTTGTEVQDIHEVLVKSIVGIRPATTLIEEIWDGTDYAGQEVPDGTYPFRFVTALNSADIDSVTGEMLAGNDASAAPADWKIQHVADTYEYQNLHKATIAIGDGRFVCADWEKTVFFYPNPFNDASKGTLEITKMPVPGEVSIKFFNLAGDLVRDGGYICVDANNYEIQMGSSLAFQPDNNISNTPTTTMSNVENIRNAALRCKWDRTNQHGKKVARGVYFGLVDFKARMGREHCQKVVKVLIP